MVETIAKPFVVRDGFAPSLLKSFARMLIEFGRLERIVYLAIKSIKREGYSEGLKHALKQWQFQKVCDELLRLFVAEYGGPASERLGALLADAKQYAATRNELVHAMWTIDNGGRPVAMRIRLDRRTKQLVESGGEIDRENLDELTGRISRAWRSLNYERKRWKPVSDAAGLP